MVDILDFWVLGLINQDLNSPFYIHYSTFERSDQVDTSFFYREKCEMREVDMFEECAWVDW